MMLDPTRYYIRRPGALGVFLQGSLAGLDGDSHVEINAYGLRGRLDRPTDTLRILAIGGSTVEDNLLNDRDTWTGKLEQRLGSGAWVGNMGRSGTDSRHHVLQLEKCLRGLPKADAILVLCGLNDMLYGAGAHADQPPTDDEGFGAIPGRMSYDEPPGTFDLGDVIQAYKDRRAAVGDEDWIHAAPNLGAALVAYHENLDRMATLALRQPTHLVLVTQPAIWHPAMTPDELAHLYAGGLGSPAHWSDPRTRWYAPDVLREMLGLFNQTMRAVAARRRVGLIDLANELEPEVANYIDDFHFSKRGADRVAEIVADGLDRLSIRVARRKATKGASSMYPVW